jgi:rhodanese-related sulfurtransferase
LVPKATTRIVVNCAGRTRSIIGAQSLINAGIPNPVCALRNGTIGWQLAGLALAHKAQDTFGEYAEEDRKKTAASALALLFRAGVQRIDLPALRDMQADATRTTYFMDVRTPQEYAQGHVPGAVSAPGGQLVQETDVYLPVRGARVVLCDNDGVRASMTATWLAQMGWESFVLKDVAPADFSETDLPPAALPDTIEPVQEVDPVTLKEWLANRSNLSMVIDVGDSSTYVKKHIPGAWWLLRSQMAQDFTRVHKANRYVLTCADGRASRYAVAELRSLVRPGIEVYWLPGGNASWMAQGFSTQQGESYVASPRIDKYRRPYEGADHSPQAMQAYLDWEHGLVEQLLKDGTHGFKVI